MVRGAGLRAGSSFVMLLCGITASATTYEGSLAYSPPSPLGPDDGLYVTGSRWPDCNVSMSWTVTDEDHTHYPLFPWKYTYTFGHDGEKGAISHISIEASDGICEDDIVDASGDLVMNTIGLHTPGPGNPGMPEGYFGIKFEAVYGDPKTATWSFYCNRSPVWGDFFAKDGGNPTNVAYNYNKDEFDVERGFLSPDVDPTAPPCNGSIDYHILRPDTYIPEPATLLLLTFAAPTIFTRRR